MAGGYYFLPCKHGEWAWKWMGARMPVPATVSASVTRGIAGRATMSRSAGLRQLASKNTVPALSAAPRSRTMSSTASSSGRVGAGELPGERIARWRRQWQDIIRVDKFPREDWEQCGTILAFLGFTELTIISPMRKQELKAATRPLV